MMTENKINYYIKMTDKPNNTEFVEWLSKCPTNYDEILETSDNDVITINFHGKNISIIYFFYWIKFSTFYKIMK